MLSSKFFLFPHTTELTSEGHLAIGGCDVTELVAAFGSPLYVFDEATLRAKCTEFRSEFSRYYQNVMVIYACKAFINPALAILLNEEGLGLDVVSAGEIMVAQSADFPSHRVYFHGNNKSNEELELALDCGIGQLVVDSLHELDQLSRIAQDKKLVPDISIRLSPGVDPHTHQHITTGTIGSKFGLPIATGQAEEAVKRAIADPNLNLVGLHFHIGSSIFEVEPYKEAIRIAIQFAAQMNNIYGLQLKTFSPGGGFAISYTSDSPAPPIAQYAEAIGSTLLEQCHSSGIEPPQLIIEPGRAIVGQAGVALYTVGAKKEIPGVRRYIFLDGGMADNIRPTLYESEYEALVANKAEEQAEADPVAIAGKFCESGDILIQCAHLPTVDTGDIIAIPACGAYSIPLASNYNASLKPAILLVKNGGTQLIRRRETYKDLVSLDNVANNRPT